jgi:acyl dehydratase
VKLYYEDLEPGAVYETGGMTVTEDAIIRFAMDWDVQDFHVDKVAAQSSIFGGLIASGLHTLAITFRLCNQEGLFTKTAVAGLGFDKVRFHEPVHAGSTLRARATVVGKRMSGSRPGVGIVTWQVATFNEKGRQVLSLEMSHMIALRNPGDGKAGG